MPKPKNSPALYELIARDRVKGRPDLQIGGRLSSAPAPHPDTSTPPPAPRPRPAPRKEKPAKPKTPRAPSRIGRMLRDPTNITAMICAAALISFGAFIAIKWRQGELATVAAPPSDPDAAVERTSLTLFAAGDASRPSGAEADEPIRRPRLPARIGQSAPPRQEPAPQPASPQAAPPAVPGARETGLNYVVVENFGPEHRADAEAAVGYLTKQGVPCTIEKRSRGGYYVVTTDGYAGNDPRLDAVVKRVRALGAEYFEEGGRYRFLCFAKRYDGGDW